MIDVHDALDYINCASLDYDGWIRIGMALEDASRTDPSVSWHDWDNWSSTDPSRYVEGECEHKWKTFNSTGKRVTKGTLIMMAMDNGFKPTKESQKFFEWDGVIMNDYEPDNLDMIKFFETMYNPDDMINYVFDATYKEDKDKWVPSSRGLDMSARDIVKNLERYKNVGQALRDYNTEAGGWVRINPVDGDGIKNENIADYKYVLVESDDLDRDEQLKKIYELRLPAQAIVDSGGKSIHALVHVDAKDLDEYKSRVAFIFKTLSDRGYPVDMSNRNPSRLCRMPGLKRGNKKQHLIDIKAGYHSFDEWKDFIDTGIDDFELPDIENYADVIDNPPELAPVLIDNLLRCGHKMIISGPSKAGKSFALIELAAALCEGREWLGFECEQCKVLYINLEIDDASFWERVKNVYQAKGWTPTAKNLDVWNLRGRAMPLSELSKRLIKLARSKNYGAIILDPVYKVQAGDENSAGDIAKFTNDIDRIAVELGASVIYCHHHSKGSQNFKRSIDRSSGSGVFARDPDAILDLVQLSNANFKDTEEYQNATAWRLEGTLREFPAFDPVNLFFDYPVHSNDEYGLLDNAELLDEFLAAQESASRSAKKKKRTRAANQRNWDDRLKDFEKVFMLVSTLDDPKNAAPLKDVARMLKMTEKGVRKQIKRFKDEFNTEYVVENGIIFNKKMNSESKGGL